MLGRADPGVARERSGSYRQTNTPAGTRRVATLPPESTHALLTRWEYVPAVTLGIAVVAALYLFGVWRVHRAHPARPWPWPRTLAFLAGLAVVVFATESGIGAYDDVLFWVHMWQHLLLLMVAPPLLLLGQPITLLLHASRNPLHTWVKRALRSRAVGVVTFPLIGVAIYALTVVGTHLTGFMNLVLTHEWVHNAEHVIYLVAGCLYFLPVIGGAPIRWRLKFPGQLGLLILVMPIDTFTGMVLGETDHPMFSAYAGRRTWGPSQVTDLNLGGAVMWIGGDAIMLAFIVLFAADAFYRHRTIEFGSWLEAARQAHFDELAPRAAPADEALTLDEDDTRLEAYNAYLARLARAGPDGDHP